MYNVNSQPILKYKSKIYIASKIDDVIDDYGSQKSIYDEPKPYRFNVQTLNKSSEIMEFGDRVNSTKVIQITEKKKYLNRFKEFDLVYVDTTPEGELEYGDNADYKIIGVRPQNTSIRVYIGKLINEQK